MEIYACKNKNTEKRMLASSGGVFTVIAEHILSIGGIVYAAIYSSEWKVIHKRINNQHDLSMAYGSKYSQSIIDDVFLEIKEDLDNNRFVLFVGTPCQCEGLYSFLRKDYTKLICIDFICHGVPSNKILYDEISNNTAGVVSGLNMRCKSSGWSHYNYSWEISFADNEKKYIHQAKVAFMQGFVKDIYLRPSCYKCAFKGIERKTDFTLGDFWGVWELFPDFDDDKGVSVIFVNTNKGVQLFHKIKECFECIPVTADKVRLYNPSINKSATLTWRRLAFFNIYEKYNLEDTLKKLGVIKDSNPYTRKKQQLGELLIKLKVGRVGIDRLNNAQIKDAILNKQLFKNKTNCCGCFACFSICSQKAISMEYDQEGFVYPFIDTKKCIDCGLCRRICPLQKGKDNKYN